MMSNGIISDQKKEEGWNENRGYDLVNPGYEVYSIHDLASGGIKGNGKSDHRWGRNSPDSTR
jgi:hypothetical protein